MKSKHPSTLPSWKISSRIKLFPFLQWLELVNKKSLRADLMAGLTGAFIVLPQGVSFAMIAGLPAEYGLYTAIIPPIVAALFGSSRHLISGPTTALSIIIFSTLSPLAEPGSAGFISLVLTLTFLAGVFQLAFGLVRLGSILNFVSHSVIVGFTAGAACLIATGQIKYAMGIDIPGGASFLASWSFILKSFNHANRYELIIALVTLICGATLKTLWPRWPGLLIAMVMGSLLAVVLQADSHGVRLLGALPGQLPPFSTPDLTFETIRMLGPGALAIALLGLIEASSIARAITVHSRQHINGNQEFIGQGLSNIIGSFFSAYASSGSFTRSGVNYESGAVTPLSGIFSALILAAIILLIAPLTAWLPLSAMGSIILIVAFKLIDITHIKEILKTSPSESFVLITTFCGTLLFQIEFAIYTGVLLSLAIYLSRMSHPHIQTLVPDTVSGKRRMRNIAGMQTPECKNSPECPELKIIRIDGSLFFGAVNHVSEYLEDLDQESPGHLLIVGSGISYIDISGAMMLVEEAQRRRAFKKDLYLCRLNQQILDFLKTGGYLHEIHEQNIFDSKQDAICHIISKLDKATCQTCPLKVFDECPVD
ncbi:MAG: SulP family inorganic anion transporter [Proteobacteria bacterium]|nr:SulP family inorganic anion transporter [Pseudomonadota bacterium]MBU1388195.1 SulP family inorganic anion transporter [Pseudomonadota bacterium]MBU1543007.1 SulP family inorganic anion transporter [Pseudomonadota bacterium]MBU2480494.1 SulP family inorganic anion transporter [Pseudomonadota bacterium]